MMKPDVFRTVNGLRHLVLTAAEWQKKPAEYKGVVAETSPLHTEQGWPVGTKTALAYDNGTILCPVIIELRVGDQVEVCKPGHFCGIKGEIVAFTHLDGEELAVLNVGDRFPRWFPRHELQPAA
jgi:hypothetical protein